MRQLKKTEVKKLSKEFNRKHEVYLLLENIQYARNVAGIFRTADAAGVRRIYLTGISQKPPFGKELQKASRHKENSVEWVYKETSGEVIQTLKKLGFLIVALELTDKAINFVELSSKLKDVTKVCFVAGSEVYGVTKNALSASDMSVYIPMYGKGASLNVATSVGVILYAF